MIPLKYKLWILKKALPHDTNISPSEVSGDEKSVRYVQIDDKKIILNVSRFRFTPVIYFTLFIIAGKWFFDEVSGETIFIIVGMVISSIFFMLALISLAWFTFNKEKYVLFDRNKGTVSIPGPFWYKNVEVPFKDLVAIIRNETYYYAHLNALNIYRRDGYKANVGINTQSLEALQHDWAFYVRYMDKNHPLPSSPVFNT